MKPEKRIFISADHGLAIVYFLQSDVLPTLLNNGVQVIVLTDDGLKEQIEQRFGQPGLMVEGLRFKQARQYFEKNNRFTPALDSLFALDGRVEAHQHHRHGWSHAPDEHGSLAQWQARPAAD